MVELETERLLLRMFRSDDIDTYAALCANAEVMRHLHSAPLSRLEAWRQMAMFVGHWHLRGYGVWAAVEKSTNTLVGRIGFLNPEGWPGFELGWTLDRAAWGKGFAIEGARAALRYAFDELKKSHVISLIHPGNVRSIRVAERLGEKPEGTALLFGIEVLVYGIDCPAEEIRS